MPAGACHTGRLSRTSSWNQPDHLNSPTGLQHKHSTSLFKGYVTRAHRSYPPQLAKARSTSKHNADSGGGSGGNGPTGFRLAESDGAGNNRKPIWALLLVVVAFGSACVWRLSEKTHWHDYAALPARISLIIPVLNEEKCIADTLENVLSLEPQPWEVIVVDGGSQDRTVEIATAKGVKVVHSQAGRARQMNHGAHAASGDVLCFLHADTHPPRNLVNVINGVMSHPKTVLGGFRTIIQTDGKTLQGMTLHHLVKTYYIAALVRPLSFVRGIKCLFGDQTLFCRAADFHSVNGFRSELPIMEDVDLCIKLHMAGPSQGQQKRSRGHVKQVLSPVNVTSGRRLSSWSGLKATYIHFYIALRWYFGATPEQMYHIYHIMYTDTQR